ncbi:MAG: hypothetical protein [Caudoviricetes sp.]|nr:MAG: hypothetical protein [Caudoviricetes sp.]
MKFALDTEHIAAALVVMMEQRSGTEMQPDGWVYHELRGYRMRSRVDGQVVITEREIARRWRYQQAVSAVESFRDFAIQAQARHKSTQEILA